jgi:hypothetical protein
MQRILLLVIVLFLVWRVLATVGRRLSREAAGADDFSRFSARRRDRRRRMEKTGDTSEEELVECAGCDTYFPATRVVISRDGRRFCSETCRGAAE